MNLAESEVGAACCVYWNGEPVVDVWGGLADREAGRPWQRDTAALVFSSTKGVTAALVHLLAQRDQLELDAPVARYWPEFAANGKQSITLRHVLTHRAGLPAVDGDLTLDDVFAWHPVCAAIAAQKPIWVPGTEHGYHARTFGWILGEVVRRVTGLTVGPAPCRGGRGAARPRALDRAARGDRAARRHDLHRSRAGRSRAARAAREVHGPRHAARPRARGSVGRAALRPDLEHARAARGGAAVVERHRARARGLARFYAALIGEVDGNRRLLSPPIVAAAAASQVEGPDRVILMPTHFASGFALPPMLSLDVPDTAFGHPGAGGSLGFADPASGLAFGYVMNQMQLGLAGDPRAERLVSAAYASLAARNP